MIDVTLFDLECVRMGLPPMSGTPQEIFEMIANSKPLQKRSINRKIKKLAKSQIKNQFLKSHNIHARQHMMVSINVSNTGKRTKVRHSLKRIRLAKSYLITKLSETCEARHNSIHT